MIDTLGLRDLQVFNQLLERQMAAGCTTVDGLRRDVEAAISRQVMLIKKMQSALCPECGKRCAVYLVDKMLITECVMSSGCGWSTYEEMH